MSLVTALFTRIDSLPEFTPSAILLMPSLSPDKTAQFSKGYVRGLVQKLNQSLEKAAAFKQGMAQSQRNAALRGVVNLGALVITISCGASIKNLSSRLAATITFLALYIICGLVNFCHRKQFVNTDTSWLDFPLTAMICGPYIAYDERQHTIPAYAAKLDRDLASARSSLEGQLQKTESALANPALQENLRKAIRPLKPRDWFTKIKTR